MALVTKQDGNFTNLSYANEVSPGVLGGSPVWFTLEPNSYKNFGANVKTKQRMPINTARQLKKAVVVDLDAGGGFQQDLTAANFQDLAQAFMFANFRTKNELNPVPQVTAPSSYKPTTPGGAPYISGDLVFAKSFLDTANNGLAQVAAGLQSGNTITVTKATLVTRASGDVGILSRVGFQFNSGDVSLTNSGTAYPTLNVTSVAATDTLTSSGVFANNDTVTIGGTVYTALTAFVPGAGNFLIGASAAISLANLTLAINQAVGQAGAGTLYDAASTPANAFVTATSTATTLVATAIASGLVGNVITATKSAANFAWGTATLVGGSGGRGWNSFGFTIGEFIFVGSDEANTSFGTAASNGFMRIRAIAQNTLTLDKTQFETVTDAGTAKTIRVYFGRFLKNESVAALQVKRTIMLERTLGFVDDTAPAAIQAEYLPGSLANSLKIDMKSADIVKLELDFLSNTSTFNTSAQGVKAGARPVLLSTDAFNSTSDVHFTRMSIVSATDGAPTPLFAFLTDLSVDVKNNVKLNKAIGVLGAFSSTAGFFQVAASLTAYFQNVTELSAVITNATVTLETHMVKFQQGVSFDFPCLVLGKAAADVKINEPIKIPLSSDASSAETIDTNLAYTMSWVFWDYLPLVA